MRARILFSAGVLVVASLFLSLLLAELILRAVAPRYEYAARADYNTQSGRLVERFPNSVTTRPHPDSGRRHLVIHNNLALRQHRDIPLAKAAGEVRIGFFGDSYTENLRIAAPYMFTEVLDYLLNLGKHSVNVLNFGVDAYGTDQSYLAYRASPLAENLDLVFYVFTANDVRNLYENDLFELDSEGRLVQKPLPERPVWLPLLSRLYLTYFTIDVVNRAQLLFGGESDPFGNWKQPLAQQWLARGLRRERETRQHDEVAEAIHGRITGEQAEEDETATPYIALLQAIVRHWRDEVEAKGGRFFVVLLPRRHESRAEAIFADFKTINLWREFFSHRLDDDTWRFQNDGHWNEFGNQLAALHLYRHSAPLLGGTPLDEAELHAALGRYYAAFPEFWRPRYGVAPAAVEPAEVTRLRARYVPLEPAHAY